MKSITKQLLAWHAGHGRHDLPWQHRPTPYRVWLSEIMLQQTQVSTVIPYYQRFLEHFPSVEDLARADTDQVLHLWTGLGYYARARNLHRAARLVCQEHGGRFPGTLEGLCELPGIGRSTAGAILSIAMNVRAPILDGNVKRVLCRYHAVAGWPEQSVVKKWLWELADFHTPRENVAAYTQAIMDLGATVCRRSRPDCERCPLRKGCQARQSDSVAEYPHRKARKKLPVKTRYMLMCEAGDGSVLLQRRPASGIWGGLWSFPEYEEPTELDEFLLARTGHSVEAAQLRHWETLRHTFSHYHLEIHPVHASVELSRFGVQDSAGWLWYPLHRQDSDAARIGLAAPVKKLLDRLMRQTEQQAAQPKETQE